VEFKDISHHLIRYRSEIETFLGSLDSERRFFNVSMERITRSELVIAAFMEANIIGIAAIERRFRIPRSLMIILGSHQGRGMGKWHMSTLLSRAREIGYSLIMGVVDDDNAPALKMDLATGYRIAGKRDNLYYIFCPLNFRGVLYFHIIRLLFPLTALVDYVRR
jgi:GNAT superfamily N-acetyltransferase